MRVGFCLLKEKMQNYQKKSSALELSIIIPVFNEQENINDIFENLSLQREVKFEIVFCDGGSNDETVNYINENALKYTFNTFLVKSEKGRAKQLNAGATVSNGDVLLFLHVDSFFKDVFALRKAMDTLLDGDENKNGEIACRFSLRFNYGGDKPLFYYHFFECKARLDEKHCIHGDQGLLINRIFFYKLETFDEELMVLEDDYFFEKIRVNGELILIPVEIYTSIRRFEAEGFFERQNLNAVIVNIYAIGLVEMVNEIREIYQSQDTCARINLSIIYSKIARIESSLCLRRRLFLWYSTGCFVQSQSWQLFFFIDTAISFYLKKSPGKCRAFIFKSFAKLFNIAFDNIFGYVFSTIIVWIWFYLVLMNLKIVKTVSK